MKRHWKHIVWFSAIIIAVLSIVALPLLPTTTVKASSGFVSINTDIEVTAQASPITINYPSNLRTDEAKLAAIYVLLEQMRLEHNKQGEIALSDWKNYEGKWAEYSKIFQAKQLPLLEEQCRLRENIRKATYTDAQWDALTLEQRDTAFLAMYGDKASLKLVATKATTSALTQLKTVILADLNGQFVDPTEVLSGYTEVDTGGYLTVTDSRVTATNLPSRTTDAYLYKDYGASHFNALDTLFECYLDTGDLNYEIAGGPGFSNTVNDVAAYASTDLNVLWRNVDPDARIYLSRGALTASDYWASASFDTLYYCRLERAAASSTATVKIYSNSARTTLLDTLSVTNYGTTTRWRYAFAFNSFNDDGGTKRITCYVQNIDLQEAAATPSINNTPSSKAFGTVNASSTYWAKTLNATAPGWPLTSGNCTFTITNDGSVSVNITANCSDFTGGGGWTLGTPASGVARLTVYRSGDGSGDGLVLTNAQQTFKQAVAASGTVPWELKFETPTAFPDSDAKSAIIQFTAVAS